VALRGGAHDDGERSRGVYLKKFFQISSARGQVPDNLMHRDIQTRVVAGRREVSHKGVLIMAKKAKKKAKKKAAKKKAAKR
jgi:hypothetical protein